MSSADRFLDFIQTHDDAAGLEVYMSDERHFPAANDEQNNLILFEACRDGAAEICGVVLSLAANVNYAGVDQQTPMFIACKNAHPACVDLLLAYGVDVNAGDLDCGRTPLMATAVEVNTPAGLTFDQFIENRCRCMRSLLAVGAAIDQTDDEGRTALMEATWNFQLAELLVSMGANVNILDDIQTSVLHIATGQSKTDVVELLLEHGADVDAVYEDGWTPLHWACLNLCPSAVNSLLRHGANIDLVTNNGRTAFQATFSRPTTCPNRVDVMHLLATCFHARLETSLAEWIRLAQHLRRIPL